MINRAVNRLRIESLNFGSVTIEETPTHDRIMSCITQIPEASLLACKGKHQMGLKDEWYTVVAYDVFFDVEDRHEQIRLADVLWNKMMACDLDDSVSTEWIAPHRGIHKITY